MSTLLNPTRKIVASAAAVKVKPSTPCPPQTSVNLRTATSKRSQALWTFVRHEGVEPTNNASDRAIRPRILWRKGRFGIQSAEGSRFVEAMMTVVATLSSNTVMSSTI